MFDYSKLRGRNREIMGTEGKFAEAMGVSGNTISQKLNGNIPWKNGEILTACKILDIDVEFIPVYFFTEKVQNSLTDGVKSEEGENNNEEMHIL